MTTQPQSYELLREVAPQNAQRLLSAALECFAERGYHAATTRDIASKADMSAAGVYVYYQTKQDLLLEIMRRGHGSASQVVTEAVSSTEDPVQQIYRFVSAFSVWHAEHHTIARVCQYELHALNHENLNEIIAFRRATESTLDRVIQAGIAAGVLRAIDTSDTSRALLSLCIDIARWFPSGWSRPLSELGNVYGTLALRMLGCNDDITASAAQG